MSMEPVWYPHLKLDDRRPASADFGALAEASAGAFPGATQRPHICFVAPNIWPAYSGTANVELVGGAEVQQCLLARQLVRHGYRVSIVCADYGQPALLVRDGITFVTAFDPDAGIPVLRFLHPRLSGLWRALRQVDADIYYQRTAAMFTAVVAAFCRRHGKRSIYASASDRDFLPGRQAIRYWRDRWLFERGLALVDAVVVQSARQAQLCARHYRRKATLIPSLYEVPDGAGPEAAGAGSGAAALDKPYVLWVAAMRRGKRPEVLFEVARRLPYRRFVMIGGPADSTKADLDYYEAVRREARQIGNIDFVGFLPLPRVEPYFDRARVVFNTSDADGEGMPNVFLQAWARGVPTVAFFDTGSRVDGAPVYPVVATVDEASATIERLFGDPGYHAGMTALCARYFAENHSSARVLDQYRRLFDQIAPRGRP